MVGQFTTIRKREKYYGYIYIVYLFTDIFLLFVGFGNPVAWGRARSRSAQLGSAGRRGGRLRAAFRQPGAGNTAYSSKNCAQAQQSQIIKKTLVFPDVWARNAVRAAGGCQMRRRARKNECPKIEIKSLKTNGFSRLMAQKWWKLNRFMKINVVDSYVFTDKIDINVQNTIVFYRFSVKNDACDFFGTQFDGRFRWRFVIFYYFYRCLNIL